MDYALRRKAFVITLCGDFLILLGFIKLTGSQGCVALPSALRYNGLTSGEMKIYDKLWVIASASQMRGGIQCRILETSRIGHQ
jgi:hypothetical protein